MNVMMRQQQNGVLWLFHGVHLFIRSGFSDVLLTPQVLSHDK
jgi:hypothetical protein